MEVRRRELTIIKEVCIIVFIIRPNRISCTTLITMLISRIRREWHRVTCSKRNRWVMKNLRLKSIKIRPLPTIFHRWLWQKISNSPYRTKKSKGKLRITMALRVSLSREVQLMPIKQKWVILTRARTSTRWSPHRIKRNQKQAISREENKEPLVVAMSNQSNTWRVNRKPHLRILPQICRPFKWMLL